MISVIVTACKEPKTIGKALYSFLNSCVEEEFEIIATAPDEETAAVVREYAKHYPRVRYLKDPGKGKMHALHLAFREAKGGILVLTDGDVACDTNAFQRIIEPFKEPEVGCVSGRPVPANSRGSMFGFWSHLLTHAAHMKRLGCAKNREYLTCSGYLFAFRNKVIDSFPLDVPEDAYIPYRFMKLGYRVAYAPRALVYVTYPDNIRDWLEQKRRIAKAYENYKLLGDMPMMKSFSKELLEGPLIALSFPRSLREFYWALMLFPARLYMWSLTFWDISVMGRKHSDGWNRVESTK